MHRGTIKKYNHSYLRCIHYDIKVIYGLWRYAVTRIFLKILALMSQHHSTRSLLQGLTCHCHHYLNSTVSTNYTLANVEAIFLSQWSPQWVISSLRLAVILRTNALQIDFKLRSLFYAKCVLSRTVLVFELTPYSALSLWAGFDTVSGDFANLGSEILPYKDIFPGQSILLLIIQYCSTSLFCHHARR